MYKFAANLLKVVLSLFGRIEVYQKENLPKTGGYVIACTHTGWVDILWLGIATLPKEINYMAKKELFQSKMMKWLMYHLHAFPVDRENPGPSSIKVPRRLLAEGKVVGIFPSGTRKSEDVPLKRGAVTIAANSKVPIIPAAYIGPNNFKDLFKRRKPKLIYGKPIYLPENESKKVGMEIMMNHVNEEFIKLQEQLRTP
ncbi:lysophospholipid acyltransferase family protein [Gracilibacillus xinjiangensis]|uniref:1-acyl-sn-glycerol-3-phosphate acyltransferase n=1 Tax=Gracilibacillus xinjiangensis TaxID=1193282 RepID=A0ABV8WUG8_9BACI